jgi:hypothetical protein
MTISEGQSDQGWREAVVAVSIGVNELALVLDLKNDKT